MNTLLWLYLGIGLGIFFITLGSVFASEAKGKNRGVALLITCLYIPLWLPIILIIVGARLEKDRQKSEEDQK